MATYRDKIQKYRARIKECQNLGIPPRETDVKKLMYFAGRAEKKGADHEVKLKDDRVLFQKAITKDLGKLMEQAMKLALK